MGTDELERGEEGLDQPFLMLEPVGWNVRVGEVAAVFVLISEAEVFKIG